LGFDLSSYDEPLNNLYKGTDNYLPSDAKGFNSLNWQNQMQTVFREFKDVEFYWVDAKKEFIQKNNLSYLTKAEFCDKVVTL
jgi:basic membrane lipoprotein Med (substrate-binding protein (PBP1-ABC) superfamily)